MKILQKRTSRFVASLFNGLGIIACVSVTSCGSKGNETDEFDGLKNKLKEANDNFEQLDVDDQNKIAEWFKDNPSQTNFTLSKDILEEIFIDNNSKLHDVAQTLEIDTDTDAEENKLDSDDLKKKVAQKNIEKNIDSTDANAFNKAVHDAVSEEETKIVTVKIAKEGKASIVYSDNSQSFVFNTLQNLQDFVNALADKKVVKVVDGNFSLVLGNDKAKVCGHKDGFDYTDHFNELLSCLNSLVQIKGLDFKGFQLTVDKSGVYLNDNQLQENYCKKRDFWTQVKNYPALFGLNSNRLPIEQNKENVKIHGFETKLNWNEVVGEGNSTIKDGWATIFDLKSVKAQEEPKKEEPKKEEPKKEEPKKEEKKKAKVKEEEKKTTTISYDMINTKAKVGNDVVELTKLKEKLNGLNSQNVEIADFPTWDTFTDVDKLSSFLNYIKVLWDAKVYKEKINVSLNGKIVSFGSQKLNENIVANVVFWQSLKDNISFLMMGKKFLISYDGDDVFIYTSKGKTNQNNGVKIANGFNSFFKTSFMIRHSLKTDWETIFEKI